MVQPEPSELDVVLDSRVTNKKMGCTQAGLIGEISIYGVVAAAYKGILLSTIQSYTTRAVHSRIVAAIAR